MNTKLNIESIIDGSIEKSKLAESVQESLSKADAAMQSTDVETLLEDFVHKDDTINFANDLTGVVEATPEMFTYRPSAGDKSVRDESAVIRRIKGNTSVWGQRIRNGNFAEGTRYSTSINTTLVNNGDGSINIVNNGSGSDGISQLFVSPIPAKHKVLIVMDYKRSSTAVSNVVFYLTNPDSGIYDKSYIYSVSSDSRRIDSAILETTNDTNMILLYPFIKGVAGEYTTMYSYMAIDLTDLFGAGNEPTTYEEFRALYPKKYYPYSAPVVRAMRVTGIETIGYNAYNGEYAEVIGGQAYYLGGTIDTAHFATEIGGEGAEITIPENRLYTPSTNGYIYATGSDICINLSHSGVRNGEYKPYEKNTLLLPEIAKYFPEGMHGIGDVFDEINEEMAIQRCAVRAYEEGDENNAEVKTDKTTTVYKLSEPIYTPIAEPLQLAYKVDDFGTEKMLSDAPSSPFKADIVYQFNAEGRIRDNSRNIERLENNIIDIRDGANKGKTSVQSITINGESKTPDENGIIDLGNIYVTTLTYKATSKVVENTEYPWSDDTFGAPIISHEYNETTGVGIIYFSGRITTIGFAAFAVCSSLTEITIPDSVTLIENFAFSSCSSLTSVTIGSGVTTIGSEAFLDCDNLTSVTIPNSVTTIGSGAFNRCSNLTSITIPNSVTTIGSGAFYECTKLTSITIPDSVTTIGDRAFNRCSSLTDITIPNNVTTIGEGAFSSCDNLTSVTIPDSVTSIGEGAFSWCESLTSVYCKATTPPAGGSDMFVLNASGRKIYVPMESVDAYKSATCWSDYADDIVGYRFNANFNDYYTKSETDDIIEVSIEKSKLAESVQESLSNIEKLENDKQDKLISGTNIKTINEESILGEGDFVIDGNNIWVANDLAQETQYLNTTIKQYGELIESKYVKSETGIPVADLSEEVQTSLSKADTAIQLSDLEYFKLPGTLEQYKDIDSNITLTESDWQLISLGVNNRKHIVIESSTGRVYSVTYSIPIVPQELYTGHMTFIAENIRFNIRIFAKTSTTAIMSVTKEVLVTENSLNQSLQNLIYVANFDTYMLYEVLYYPSKYYDIDIRPLCDAITQKRTIIVNQETSVSTGGYIANGVINSQDNELVLIIQLSTGCYKITLSTENDIARLNSDTVTFISYTKDKTIESVDTSYNHTDFDLESGELLKLQNENGIETLKLAVASDTDVKGGIFADNYGYSPLIMAHTAWNLYTDLQTQIDNIYYNVSSITRAGTHPLQPNTFYKFGRPEFPISGTIDITLGTEISGVVNEYIFEIYTNATTVPTLSLPDTIKWVSGDAPVLEENKIYQISIVNNLGTVLSWDNA